jgi:hypothetical protein
MTKHIDWERVTRDEVTRAINEYDRLGAADFFLQHGYAAATTYQLLENGHAYPPKAILGAAYEFATGRRLSSPDFEGGATGAVKVLTALGYRVSPKDA